MAVAMPCGYSRFCTIIFADTVQEFCFTGVLACSLLRVDGSRALVGGEFGVSAVATQPLSQPRRAPEFGASGIVTPA